MSGLTLSGPDSTALVSESSLRVRRKLISRWCTHVPCPDCGAAEGSRCRDGTGWPINLPHDQRAAAGRDAVTPVILVHGKDAAELIELKLAVTKTQMATALQALFPEDPEFAEYEQALREQARVVIEVEPGLETGHWSAMQVAHLSAAALLTLRPTADVLAALRDAAAGAQR
jgi:hypothetical protein